MLGNWIDLLVCFFMFFSFYSGFYRKFFNALGNFMSFVLAVLLSLFTYLFVSAFFANNFQLDTAFSHILGFFVSIGVIKFVTLYIWKRIVKKYSQSFKFSNDYVDSFLGGCVAVLQAFFVALFVISVTTALNLPQVLQSEVNASTIGIVVNRDPFGLNRELSRIFGGILVGVEKRAELLMPKQQDGQVMNLGVKLLETQTREDLEQEMLNKINYERLQNGLQPLVMDEQARQVARDYGRYIFKFGHFAHNDLEGRTPSERMREAGVEYLFTGENLAFAKDLDTAHRGLMNSEGHRANILHVFFSKVGIGVIDGGQYGVVFVQEFWS